MTAPEPTAANLFGVFVLLVSLVVLPGAVIGCAQAFSGHAVPRDSDAKGSGPALLFGALFLAILGLTEWLICWRQAAYDNLIIRMLPPGGIILVPGWAQLGVFAIAPAVITSQGLLRVTRHVGRGRSLRPWKLRLKLSPTVWLTLIGNIVFVAVSFPSYAVFGAHDVLLRPWPYGGLATYRLTYDQVTAITTTRLRNLGRFGGSLPIDDFTIVFATGLTWTTRYNADGSSDLQRILALRRVAQRSGVTPRPWD